MWLKQHLSILCALMSGIAVIGCRTTESSSSKDIGGSPVDVNQPSYVVYLTSADALVHKGECPATNSPVNRSCPGLKDLKQLAKTDYELGLRKSILSLRPGGIPTTPDNPALVKALEDKIARIAAKLSGGGLSESERKALESQLAELNRQLGEAKITRLTSEEQSRFDFIMQKLNSNDDVTFDEGETNYKLAVAPFGGISSSMTFVKIPAGTFMMGSPDTESGRVSDEGPQHQVTISKGFELQATEVTQGQWVAVMGSNPSYFTSPAHCPGEHVESGGLRMCPNNPVEQVSWDDAQEFIQKLNSRGDGYRYRLPTEAEWEYAARAGTTGPYAGKLDALAWYGQYPGGRTHPVAKKQSNAWGLYDMHGNVWEWTADWYGSYRSGAVSDPTGPSTGSNRVRRGGSWHLGGAQGCRSAARGNSSPDIRGNYLGFRLLRTNP
jgi:formylglycine-generating enzyme required for sulfatase activity